MSDIFINRKRQKKIRKILILIVIFLAAIGVGITLCIKAVSLNKNPNKVKAAAYKPKTAQIKKVKIDLTKQIVSNSNVSEEGKKYTYDALEIQKIINEGKKQVDGHKIAFLTFDDGPSTTVTPKILNILKGNNVHATFSLIGREIEQNNESKAIVKQEIEQGNAIGNHTYSHNYNILCPNRTINVTNFMNEVDQTDEILKSILGEDFHTRVVRIPGGHMSWRGTKPLDDEFDRLGYVYVDWNDDDEDSIKGAKDSHQIVENVKKYDCGQDRLVIILHDTYGKEAVAEALPEIIQFLKGQGYEFRTLS